jgi:hypothetical protein
MNANVNISDHGDDERQGPEKLTFPVYQTSVALHLIITIIGLFVIFNGPRVGC